MRQKNSKENMSFKKNGMKRSKHNSIKLLILWIRVYQISQKIKFIIAQEFREY